MSALGWRKIKGRITEGLSMRSGVQGLALRTPAAVQISTGKLAGINWRSQGGAKKVSTNFSLLTSPGQPAPQLVHKRLHQQYCTSQAGPGLNWIIILNPFLVIPPHSSQELCPEATFPGHFLLHHNPKISFLVICLLSSSSDARQTQRVGASSQQSLGPLSI